MTNLKIKIKDFIDVIDFVRCNKGNKIKLSLGNCQLCGGKPDFIYIYYSFDQFFRFNYQQMAICSECEQDSELDKMFKEKVL
jgi:hypothetical protein